MIQRLRRNREAGRDYASEPQVAPQDRPLLETPAGRDNDQGAADRGKIVNNDMQRKDVGAKPRADVTGQHFGSGDDETVDGLNESDEAMRRAAEDTPVGEDENRDTPVFDRGRRADKV